MKRFLHTAALLLAAVTLFAACAATGTKAPGGTTGSGESTPAGTTAEPGIETTAAETTEETFATETAEPTETPVAPEDADDRAFLDSIEGLTYRLGARGEAYYFGRWFEKEIDGVNHHVTVTDGSQIFLLTEGCESVDFDFTVITKRKTPYFAVSIDGEKPKRQLITEKTVALPDAGRHLLRVVVDSMEEAEAKWREEAGVALREIRVPEGGQIRAIMPKNKVVFFYGDSITEGIMVLAASNQPKNNSSVAAYPWTTCERLNAVPYYVGYSGSGVQVVGSFAVFSEAVNHYSRDRKADLETVKPDVIVINHGTNDGNSSDAGFRGSLKTAIGKIAAAYPGVPIVYMLPFCGNRASDIRTVCAEFENVTVVETDRWKITYSDGLHPNRTGAKRAGEALAKEIEKLLGKDFFKV